MRVECHPPIAAVSYNLLLGGTTTFLVNLAKGINSRGHRLSIVAFREPNEHVTDFSAVDARVDVLCSDNHLIYEDRIYWAYSRIARVSPRMIIANLGSESFEILRIVPPGVVRVGMVQSLHEPPILLARAFSQWCDVVVGVSTEICDALIRRGVSHGLVRHIPYGVDFGRAVDRESNGRINSLRVVYVGRIVEEQKRISRLVELISRAAASNLPVKFTIIGAGPDGDATRRCLASLPNVTWLGKVPHRAIVEHLRHQDLFVLFSDYEGLPISVIEAMGQGVVPIVSDLPSGIDEAIPPGCGFRVPPGDISAALEIIRRLSVDRRELSHLAKRAEQHARSKYGLAEMVDEYLALAKQGESRCWPESVGIPVPIGVKPTFMFRGVMRALRRRLKGIAKST